MFDGWSGEDIARYHTQQLVTDYSPTISRRLPLDNSPVAMPPFYGHAVDQALAAIQAQTRQDSLAPMRPVQVRASRSNPIVAGNPIAAPPRLMAENTMQALPPVDMSLPPEPVKPVQDWRQGQLEKLQRYQAANALLSQIAAPPVPYLPLPPPTPAPFDVEGWLRDSRQKELERLQLAQIRQQSKPVLQGYVSNRPGPHRLTHAEAEAILKADKPTEDITAETLLDVALTFYGAKDLLALLKTLKMPLKVFLAFFKQELKQTPAIWEQVLKRKQIGSFFSGPEGITLSRFQHFKRVLDKDGVKSLLKARKNVQKQLDVHLAKLAKYTKEGGHVSSVEKEIRNFKAELKAIDYLLEGGQ